MQAKQVVLSVVAVAVLGAAGVVGWNKYSGEETLAQAKVRLAAEQKAYFEEQAKQPKRVAPAPAVEQAPALPVLGPRFAPLRSLASYNSMSVRDPRAALLGPVQRLEGQKGLVHAVKVSPDGKLVASAGSDGTVKLWEVGTWKLVRTLLGPANVVRALAFSSDGKRIAEGELGGLIQVLDATTGEIQASWQADAIGVDRLFFLPGDGELISSGCDGSVRTWKADGTALRNSGVHTSCVGGLDVSADGRQAVTASFDGTASVYDIRTGEAQPLMRLEGSAQCVTYLADGTQAVVYQVHGDALIYDLATRKIVGKFEQQVGGTTASTDQSGGLAAETYGHGVVVWSPRDRAKLADLYGPDGIVWGMDMTPDGRFVIGGGGYDRRDPNTQAGSGDTLFVWDLQAGTTGSLPGGVAGVAMATGGKRGVYVSADGALHVVAAGAGGVEVVKDVPGAKGRVSRLAIEADGQRAVVAAGTRVRLVGLADGGEAGAWELPGEVTAICSMGSGVVGAAAGREVYVCHVGKAARRLGKAAESVGTLAGFGDGSRMLSGAGQEAALWAEQTRLPGMQVTFDRKGQGAGEVLGVMASADGKLAYVLDAVNGLLFFDTGTGQCMAQISDRPGAYQGFLPGPDEGHVVLAGAACAVIDVRVPSLVARLNGPLGRALAIGFPAAGEALMVGPAGNVRAGHYEWPRQVGLEGPGEAVRVAATGKVAVQYRPWNRGGYLVVYDLERAQALRQIAVPPGGERFELTANGRWAVMQVSSGVVVANLETGQVQQVTGLQRAGALGLSEDGRTVAAADAGELGAVTLWDVGSGAQKIALEPLHTQVAGLVFSPDGSMVVASTRMGGRSAREVTTPQGAWGFEVASGKRVRSVPMTGRAPVATTFTADGSTLMVVDSQQGVQCLEGKTLALKWLASMGEGRISRVAVSADGERVLVLSGGVHLWDAGTKQQVALGPMPLEERAFPYFEAGRAMVFSLSADDNLRSNVGSVQALHPMKDGE